MRILGLDPGFERTGFAVLEVRQGKIELLDFGRIFTDKALPFSERLALLAADLRTLLRQWKPAGAACEQVFFSKNVKTAMKVSHARGVILEILQEHGVPVQEFNPSAVKIAVTGDARADKKQVQKMIQYLLKIELKSDDAADAVALGLCFLNTLSLERMPRRLPRCGGVGGGAVIK